MYSRDLGDSKKRNVRTEGEGVGEKKERGGEGEEKREEEGKGQTDKHSDRDGGGEKNDGEVLLNPKTSFSSQYYIAIRALISK